MFRFRVLGFSGFRGLGVRDLPEVATGFGGFRA